MSFSRSRLTLAAAIIVIVVGTPVGGLTYFLNRNVPVRYTDPDDRYKYGSLGTEVIGSPLYLFEAMPEVCADKLPGKGWESLGFVVEPGHTLPLGTSVRTLAVPRVGVNCALCHTGTVRETASSKPTIVFGMPSPTLDFQGYVHFILDCLQSPGFNAETVMPSIERRHTLSAFERVLYRNVVFNKGKEDAGRQRANNAWHSRRPPFGPGRYDAWNTGKSILGMHPEADDAIATVDFPAIWNQNARRTYFAHWDGSNPSLSERNHIALTLAGASADSIDEDELLWNEEWLMDLPAPKYPFPIRADLAAKGEPLFQANCARCHSPSGALTGKVTPIADIGTDRVRFDAFTPELAAKTDTLTGKRWQIRHFEKSAGYANLLLDGLWARAPYLHNGSVPNLRALLEVPENRPKTFNRGQDIYDQQNVGFVSSGPDAGRFTFDTSVRGNGNGGHRYGTNLTPEEKEALLEYLKRM